MPEKAPVQASSNRGRRDVLVGVVTSAKAAKTLTVEVQRFVKEPEFEKYVRRSTRCYVHDEKSEAREGDIVEIVSCRPMSKLKRWRLVSVKRKAPTAEAPAAEPAKG